jgi:hypothetical protein
MVIHEGRLREERHMAKVITGLQDADMRTEWLRPTAQVGQGDDDATDPAEADDDATDPGGGDDDATDPAVDDADGVDT